VFRAGAFVLIFAVRVHPRIPELAKLHSPRMHSRQLSFLPQILPENVRNWFRCLV
jgi:hypothetical protein